MSIVVRAGAIGSVAARELASDHEVTVLDRGQIAGGATGRASGIVSPQPHYEYVPEATEYTRQFLEGYDGHRNVELTERPEVALATMRRTRSVAGDSDARPRLIPLADLDDSPGFVTARGRETPLAA
jgi:glycine/D-amino acid oxidase-like deaminating enzyme